MTTQSDPNTPERPVPLSESGAGWRETTLGEVVEFQRGFDLPTNDRKVGIYPLVVSNGIDGFVDEYKVKGPGVVTGRSGTLGKVIFINENFWPLNTTLWIKDFKGNNAKFIYYWLLTFPFEKFNAGSGVPTLNRNHIHQVNVKYPENIYEQRAIADILSSLDAKIELLREQNETLEKTAQTIFQEWFGKYSVECPEKLPGGWRVGKVSDFVNILSGFAFKSDNFNENGVHRLVTIANVQDGSFVENTKDCLLEIPQKMPSYCHLKTGDILLSLTGNVGRICHVVGENYLLNQRVAKLQSKNLVDYGYTYICFRKNGMIGILESLSVGTAQQNLSPIKTAEFESILPDRDTLDRFGKIINPMIDKILSNLLQIQSLSKTRDELLPRLMSGEVRVG